MDGQIFCFGRFRLIARERALLKDGAPVHLGSRAFDLLLALVQRAGETVSRQDLFDLVWPDVVVAKVNLRVHVASLRKALGEGQNGNRFIVSVAGRGYCFVAEVSRFRFSHKRLISPGEPPEQGHGSVAFAIAYTLVTHFANALCFVDLAGTDDPAGVPMAVANALGCDIDPQPSLTSVLACLQDREMLLVFDNCDHVLAGVERLTERLFTEAPRVHVLVSSRQALRLSPLARNPPQTLHDMSST
jgi:DNA-binding winged helix-turn-helix (wHTH) protein